MDTKEEESQERLFNRQAEEIQRLRGHLNVVNDILSLPAGDNSMNEEWHFYRGTRW
jgi:hypothetical protein